MLRMNESATRLKVIESGESLLNEVLLSSLPFPCLSLGSFIPVRVPLPSLSPISPFHVNITVASDACISLKLYQLQLGCDACKQRMVDGQHAIDNHSFSDSNVIRGLRLAN